MMRESLHIKKEAFEAWRRVIEVALASCPVEILPRDTRQTVIAEVLQDMLCRVCYFLHLSSPHGSRSYIGERGSNYDVPCTLMCPAPLIV